MWPIVCYYFIEYYTKKTILYEYADINNIKLIYPIISLSILQIVYLSIFLIKLYNAGPNYTFIIIIKLWLIYTHIFVSLLFKNSTYLSYNVW